MLHLKAMKRNDRFPPFADIRLKAMGGSGNLILMTEQDTGPLSPCGR
jgi:hypothetical protein